MNEKEFLRRFYNMMTAALDELRFYRKIGTVEECQLSMLKEKPLKPILRVSDTVIPSKKYQCCECGDNLIIGNRRCGWCGQFIDWSEETNG